MNPDKEAHLVRLIGAFGPRKLALIARRLGVSRETVARSYAKLIESGLDARPNIDMGKLGLKRYVALVTPSKDDDSRLEPLFMTMGDYAYLEHYQRLSPSNSYLLVFTAPPERISDLTDFLSKVGSTSSAGVVGPAPLSWMRYHPIRAPWNPPPETAITTGPLSYVPDIEETPTTTRVGYEELLLLAAIQAYPDANLAGISRALAAWGDAGYGDMASVSKLSSAEWNEHYKRALGVVKTYPMGLARGPPGTKAKRHSWASFTSLWEGLDADGIKRAAMTSTSVPYQRVDAASSKLGLYFSIFSTPARLVPGYLTFMTRNGPDQMRVGVASKFANFSVPFSCYNLNEGRWGWKQERLESQLATLRVE